MKRLFARGQNKELGTNTTTSISAIMSAVLLAGLLVSLPQAQASGGSSKPFVSVPPPPGPSDEERDPFAQGPTDKGSGPGNGKGPVGDPGGKKAVEGLQEVPGLRSRFGNVFDVEGSGSHVAQVLNSPVNYVDESGSLEPIDVNLHPVPGGYESGPNSFQIFFPARYAPGHGVTIDYPDGSVTTTLDDARPSDAEVGEGTVAYQNVLNNVTAHYALTTDGYKEKLILHSTDVSSTFSYTIRTALDVAQLDHGGLLLTTDGEPVSVVPMPVVFDSADRFSDSATDQLTQTGPDTYRYSISIPPSWLEDPERVFPVTVDPTQVDMKCYKEITTETYCPDDEGLPLLKDLGLGSTDGPRSVDWYSSQIGAGIDGTNRQERSFLTFDVRQEVRKVGDHIYSAKFDIYSPQSATGTTQDYRLYRMTAPWADPPNAPPTWSTQPTVTTSAPSVTHNGCAEPPATCLGAGWLRWDVKGVVQHWIDQGVNSNHGFRLSNNGGTAQGFRRFYSGNVAAPNIDKRPYMVVVANALPATNEFEMDVAPRVELSNAALPDGAQIETDTPTFAIKDLSDINDDPIRVRYQVSKTPAFGDDDVVWSSGWIKKKLEVTVDAGALSGGTYFWRVQTGDVCENEMAAYIDPDQEEADAGLCDDLGHRPTSDVRTFSIGVTRRGRDPRWAMWRTSLGNDMGLSVDHASGNLLLEYPVDSLATQVGSLDIDLAYNSQAAEGLGSDTSPGLPPGWELSAGPGMRADQLPVRLKELPYDQGVVLTLRSGRRDVYARTSPGRYATVGTGAGVIQRRGDAWLLTTASGGTYRFDPAGSLVSARVSTASPTMPGFTYLVDPTSKRFDSVTDPLGRTVSFTYDNPNGKLSKIRTWDDREWIIGMTDGKITSIKDPNLDIVEFAFGTDHKLDAVIDGEAQKAPTPKPHTQITYQTMQSRPRVTALQPVGLGEYRFAYTFPTGLANALIATTSRVTDPRGVATPDEVDDDDFEKILDFTGGGLPIEIRGPETAAGWPQSRFMWDRHGNLVCKRSPAAPDSACVPPKDDGTPAVSDGLQTEYIYQERAPYLIQKRIDPAPTAGALGTRLVTRWGYDETYDAQRNPVPFKGLQAHYFDNLDLRGLPKSTAILPALQQSGLQAGFSARYFGELVPEHQNDPEIPDDEEEQNYEFKLTSTGGALVAIGNDVVIDCFAELSCNQNVYVKLPPTRVSLLVEFVNTRSSSADFNLQWRRPGITSFQTIDSVVPNTDALTMIDTRSVQDSSMAPLPISRTEFSYPSDDAKLRRLAAAETLKGQNTTDQSVAYTYDDFGRVKTETDATTEAITHTYFDPTGSFATAGVCEETTLDRVGLETTRQCDAAGRVTQEIVKVGGMLDASGAPSPTQDRVTEMTYDGVGRVETATYPDEGATTYEYDSAGRVTSETVEETDVLDRTISYEYFTSGLLKSETLPDPDRGGPLTSPVIDHEYDLVGNETETTDERGKVWLTDHDAANLPTSTTDPLGNRTDLVYDVAGRVIQRKGVDHDSDGTRVVVHKSYDVLGRVTQRRLANLDPTTFEYDLRGLVKKRTDPDGIYVENTYDAAGRVRSERRPVGTAGAGVTRTLSYNGSGWLTSEEDFKHDATTYGYDDAGHLSSVMSPVKPQDPITYTLNEAGEIEKTQIPRDGGLSPIRSENDYDAMGRLAAERDGVGNETDYTYNLAGDLLTVRDDRPVTVTSTYDGLGREITRSVTGTPTTDEDAEFGYDKAGSLTSASNAEGSVTVGYDDAGRIATVTGDSGATSYTYDGDYLISVTDDSSTTATDFVYEEATGRLASIDDPVTGETTSFNEYTDAGKLKRRTDPADVVHVYEYDPAGRRGTETATKNGDQIALFDQDYDANGRVEHETQQVDGGGENGTWDYSYDLAGRLTSADAPDDVTSFTYEYDLAGNRTRHKETTIVAGVPVVRDSTTTYDTAMRPLTSSLQVTEDGVLDPLVTTTYAHDNAGNLTSKNDTVTGWVYEYDGLSRLTDVTQSVAGLPVPVKQGLTYDPLGRNVASSTDVRTPGGDLQVTETSNHYRGLDETLAKTEKSVTLLSDVTSIETDYASGPSGVIAQKSSVQAPGASLEVSTSVLGMAPHSDISYITDLDGAVTGTKTYDPWGVVRTETGTTETDLGFQSDPTDENTGLVDMGARHYLPELGRFLTQDPAQDGINHYAYGGNDPASMWDPTGLRYMDEKQWESGHQEPTGGPNEGGGFVNTPDPVPAPIEGEYGVVRAVAVDIDNHLNPYSWAFDVATGKDVGDFRVYMAKISTELGIDPRTLMALINRESSSSTENWPVNVKLWTDKAQARWNDVTGGNLSFGMANMRPSTFNKLLQDFPQIGQGRNVVASDMVWDHELAIRALAYRLARFQERILDQAPGISFEGLQEAVASAHKTGGPLRAGLLRPVNSTYLAPFWGAFNEAHGMYCLGQEFECRF